jgi:urocanate hydratase
MGGVARRAWAGNKNAIETSIAFNLDDPEQNHITLPFLPDTAMIEKLVSNSLDKI